MLWGDLHRLFQMRLLKADAESRDRFLCSAPYVTFSAVLNRCAGVKVHERHWNHMKSPFIVKETEPSHRVVCIGDLEEQISRLAYAHRAKCEVLHIPCVGGSDPKSDLVA